MRKIDAFAHILPRPYLDRLEKLLRSTLDGERLRYYQTGVFYFDEVLIDLDARWRKMETLGDYAQVLVLAVPPLEEVGPATVAVDFARLANDEMAELVRRYPDRFVGFAAALPLNDTEASLREIDRSVSELGALGIQMFTNMNGFPIDHPRFDPISPASRRCSAWSGCIRRATPAGPTIRLSAHPTMDCGGPSAGPTRPQLRFRVWSTRGRWSAILTCV